MNIGAIFAAIGGLIAVGGAIGIVWASARSSLSTRTIAMLKEINDAWEERSRLQDLTILDLQHKLDLSNVQIEGDRLRIQTLESVAGGGAAIALMQAEMTRQHDQVMVALAAR